MDKVKEFTSDRSELFRATLGFDFIFLKTGDGSKVPFCIEINGEDSGLMAVSSIPESELSESEREKVQIRMVHTKERLELSAYAESLDPVTQTTERSEAWARARSVPGFVHAFHNPPYIREIVASKKLQQDFIPPENRPRLYQKDDSPLSRTGFWICKPLSGRKGKGIKIFSNEEFKTRFLADGMTEGYIAQELLRASGADLAPSGYENNPAAMRFLMDIIYYTDKSIEEVFSFAYQRISVHDPDTLAAASVLEDACIVNIARGASAAAASDREMMLAHEVALKIIQNIAEGYQKESL